MPDILCSALTEDCIGRGQAIKEEELYRLCKWTSSWYSKLSRLFSCN